MLLDRGFSNQNQHSGRARLSTGLSVQRAGTKTQGDNENLRSSSCLLSDVHLTKQRWVHTGLFDKVKCQIPNDSTSPAAPTCPLRATLRCVGHTGTRAPGVGELGHQRQQPSFQVPQVHVSNHQVLTTPIMSSNGHREQVWNTG